jgi:hypothetical protein
MTAEQTALATQVIRNLNTSVARIKAALDDKRNGYVHVWPEYWLAVQVDLDGYSRAVSVEQATIVRKCDKRVFRNGHNQKAVIMERKQALQSALVYTVGMRDQYQSVLAA